MCVCPKYDKNPIYDFSLFLELINFNFIDRLESISVGSSGWFFFHSKRITCYGHLFFFSSSSSSFTKSKIIKEFVRKFVVLIDRRLKCGIAVKTQNEKCRDRLKHFKNALVGNYHV